MEPSRPARFIVSPTGKVLEVKENEVIPPVGTRCVLRQPGKMAIDATVFVHTKMPNRTYVGVYLDGDRRDTAFVYAEHLSWTS